jgi:hypothetical protein
MYVIVLNNDEWASLYGLSEEAREQSAEWIVRFVDQDVMLQKVPFAPNEATARVIVAHRRALKSLVLCMKNISNITGLFVHPGQDSIMPQDAFNVLKSCWNGESVPDEIRDKTVAITLIGSEEYRVLSIETIFEYLREQKIFPEIISPVVDIAIKEIGSIHQKFLSRYCINSLAAQMVRAELMRIEIEKAALQKLREASLAWFSSVDAKHVIRNSDLRDGCNAWRASLEQSRSSAMKIEQLEEFLNAASEYVKNLILQS